MIIGDPTLYSPKYNFTQTPLCNYPETVTVTDLPAFAFHNVNSSKFEIPQTENLTLDGIYTVTLRSEIQVPTDYTKT